MHLPRAGHHVELVPLHGVRSATQPLVVHLGLQGVAEAPGPHTEAQSELLEHEGRGGVLKA